MKSKEIKITDIKPFVEDGLQWYRFPEKIDYIESEEVIGGIRVVTIKNRNALFMINPPFVYVDETGMYLTFEKGVEFMKSKKKKLKVKDSKEFDFKNPFQTYS
jgi:hypothetical protein